LYLTALAILAMALILIGLDLGHPFRFWHVFIYPQWGSLMTWMIWLHLIYLVVLLGKLIVETALHPAYRASGSAPGWPTSACR
jgi:protein NrfD